MSQMALISTCNKEPGATYAHAIRVATGKGFMRWAPYNHSAIAFLERCGTNGVYYESWIRVNPETGKNGVQGPLPLSRLGDWKAENPSKRLYRLQHLPFGPEACSKAREYADGLVGTEYAKLQILHNAKRAILGAGSLPFLRSPEGSKSSKMTCSEFAALVIDHADWRSGAGIDREQSIMRQYLEIGTRNVFDDISPAGQLGLHEAIEAMLSERAHSA